MLSGRTILKPVTYLPHIAFQRGRVRLLPKEYYDEYETPYMKARRPGRAFVTDFYAFFHQKDLILAAKNWYKEKKIEAMRNDQRYIPDRHKILGPDLAVTHFIAYRGGKIKFKGKDSWATIDHIRSGEVPCKYEPGYFVEELDASGLSICYEGFENLSDLICLKKLYLRNCPNVDDWCLSRSYLFENSLEYLDISGCHNVTERGICALHALKNLRTLVLNDTPNIGNKELVSLLLQEIIPKCQVIGVNYEDPTLLKRVGNYM
ncbi:hypothetical protein X975_20039, partial [Stegodyphus mimosarum]